MADEENRVEVGTEVLYVPGKEYALIKDPHTGDYPWAIGYIGNPQGRVDELVSAKVDETLSFIRRHPMPDRERKKLRLLRPLQKWSAVVRAVNQDGSVALDVDRKHGITLHLENVKEDPSGQEPGTFYLPPEQTEE